MLCQPTDLVQDKQPKKKNSFSDHIPLFSIPFSAQDFCIKILYCVTRYAEYINNTSVL